MAQSVEKKKTNVINAFRETHFVTHACKKAGVSTSAYYRWRYEDAKFKLECDRAREEGRMRLCDYAESNLVSAVRKGDIPTSKYVLENYHPDFKKRSVNAPAEPNSLEPVFFWDKGLADMLLEARRVNKETDRRDNMDNGDNKTKNSR
ncbi:hypothetical protein KA525_03065 [Candidatus Woesebacteria bacterium]|jgi:hypothetical protein|nr:hypothetical protein [Candidatus Woesebacteria bacterium]